jgi:hypothetical protein
MRHAPTVEARGVGGQGATAALLGLPAAVVGLALAWFALAGAALPPTPAAAWADGLYAIKEAAAAAVQERKILLIGGSATHFSYRAATVSAQTRIAAVNFGTHAGLGARYLLDRARGSLRRGDVAVLALEHQLLTMTRPPRVLSEYTASFDLAYVGRAGLREAAQLVFGLDPLTTLRTQIARPPERTLYRLDTVAANGDESANTVALATPTMMAKVVAHEPIPLGDLEAAPAAVWEFAQWAQIAGVTVLYAWPPTLQREIYDEPEYRAYFDATRTLYGDIGIAPLGEVDEFMLAPEQMADDPYHANESGAEQMSKLLATKLCAVIECAVGPAQ